LHVEGILAKKKEKEKGAGDVKHVSPAVIAVNVKY
jgi:hypothetical protein